MIRHEAPGVNSEIEQVHVSMQVFKKLISVSVILKGNIAGVGPGEDMIKTMGKIYSFWPCHDKDSKQGGRWGQELFSIFRGLTPKCFSRNHKIHCIAFTCIHCPYFLNPIFGGDLSRKIYIKKRLISNFGKNIPDFTPLF